MCACVCICIYADRCTFVYTYIHTYTYILTYIHTYIHTYIQTKILANYNFDTADQKMGEVGGVATTNINHIGNGAPVCPRTLPAREGPVRDATYNKIECFAASVKNGSSFMAIREDHGKDWIDCILGQLIYRFKKMSTQQKDELAKKGYKVDKINGEEEVLKGVTTWLKGDGRTKAYVPPYQGKEINCDLPNTENSATRSAKASVEKFCLDTYGMPIDKYADIVIGKEEKPVEAAKFDFDLAIFAFSRIYDQTRVSVLCPQEKQKKKTWKIWDSDGFKPSVSKVHLTFGDLGDRQYVSLVDKADKHVYANIVDDDAPAVDTGVSANDYEFKQCELCEKVRLFPEKAVKHCKNSNMQFEGMPGGHNTNNGCKDAAIFSMIRDFFSSSASRENTNRKEKTSYIREFDDVESPGDDDGNQKKRVLNLTYFFFAVQAVGSIQGFKRKMSKLSLMLGVSVKAETLRKLYEDIFLKPQRGNRGGLTLERFLKSKQEVCDAINACRKDILRDLELKAQFSFEISAPQLLFPTTLPGLFRDRADAEQSEDFWRVMHELIQNAKIWLQAAEGSPHIPRWKDAVENLATKAHKLVHSNEIRQNNLVMLGINGVGKSFLMDILLRVSESDRTKYKPKSVDDEAESLLLAKERFRRVGELSASQTRNAGNSASGQALFKEGGDFDNGSGAGQDEMEDESARWLHCETFSISSLPGGGGGSGGGVGGGSGGGGDGGGAAECITNCEIEMELRHAKHIADSHAHKSGSLKCDGKSTSFLLPWGKNVGSTTKCSISVRRAPQYEIALEYRSQSEIVLGWNQFKELETKLADQTLDRDSPEYTDYITKQKQIVAEVKEATGFTLPEARTYLAAFKAEQLQELPLSEVVRHKILCFVGGGSSALHDRMLIRSIVHHCQGIDDPVLGKKSPTKILNSGKKKDGSVLNPCEFGQRTGFALKRITIFAPCELAPLKDSEWIDTAGSGDSNLIKKKVLEDALGQASAVIVMAAKNLGTAAETMEALAQTSAMAAIMEQLIEDPERIPQGKVSVLHNYERSFRDENSRAPSLQDLKRDEFKGQDPQGGTEGSIASTKEALHDVAESVLSKRSPEMERGEVEKKACSFDEKQPVNILIPAPATAVSLIMTDSLPATDRQEWLEETQMLELFGTVEVFLRGGTHAVLGEFLPCLNFNLARLTMLEKTLEESKPKVTVPRQFIADAQKRLQNKAKTADIIEMFTTKLDNTFMVFDDISTTNLAAKLQLCLRKKSRNGYEKIALEMDSEIGEIDTISKRIKEFTSHGIRRFKNALTVKGKLSDRPLTNFAKTKISEIFDFASAASPGLNKRMCDSSFVRNDFVYDSLQGGLTEMINTALDWVCTRPILKLAQSEADELIKDLNYRPEASEKLCKEVEEHAKEQFIQHKDDLIKTLVKWVGGEVNDLILVKAKDKLLKNLEGVTAQELITGDYLLRYLCDVLHGLIQSIRKQLALTALSKSGAWGQGRKMTAYDEFVCNLGIRQPPRRMYWSTKTMLSSICECIQTKLWHDPTALSFLESQKTQISAACADFKKLQKWMEKSQECFGAADSQDLKQIGRRLSDNFRRMRVMERIADELPEAQAALPTEASSDYADFTKRCPGGGAKGYIDYDPDNHAEQIKACNVKAVADTRKFLLHLKHLTYDFNDSLRQLVGVETFEDPDVLLSWYCRYVLGMDEEDSTDPGVTQQLRKRIQWQALESLHTSFPDGTEFEGVNDFSERITQEDTYPDFLSLALLARHHQRPINVYVPWDPEKPLRISPSLYGEGSKSSTEFTNGADAIAFIGYRTKGKKKVPLFVPCGKRIIPAPLTRARSRRQDDDDGADKSNGAGAMDLVDEDTEDPGNDVTPGMSRSVSPARASDNADESDVSTYTLDTFAASEWQYSIDGARMYSRHDLTYGEENFGKLSAKYLQFAERYVFIRAKTSNTTIGVLRQCPCESKDPCVPSGRYSPTCLHLPCDDAFAHDDNFMGVFDGVGEMGYQSGQMARILASRCISSSQDVTSGMIHNRSYEILRIVHEKSIAMIQTRFPLMHGKPFIGASTASIVSLIKKRDEFELHCAWHGDSQIVVMGPGPDYQPKFVSVRTYVEGGRELTPRKTDRGIRIPGTRVRLKKNFKGLEKGVTKEVLNYSDAMGYQIDDTGGGTYVGKKVWEECLEPLSYNPTPTQLNRTQSVFDPGKHKIPVKDGDIVLLASDGLYDNILPDRHDKKRWNQKTDTEHEKRYAMELGQEIAKIFKLHHEEFQRIHDPQTNWLQHIGNELSGRAMKTMDTDVGKHDDLTVMISQIKRGQIGLPEHAPIHKLFHHEEYDRKTLCDEIKNGKSMYCTSFAKAATRMGGKEKTGGKKGGVTCASVAARIGGTD